MGSLQEVESYGGNQDCQFFRLEKVIGEHFPIFVFDVFQKK